MSKAISLYEIKYPANAEIMLQELRKLIDFEMLKPDFFIKTILPDFDLSEFLTGMSKKKAADVAPNENEAEDAEDAEEVEDEEDGQLPSNLESSGMGSANPLDNLS